MVISYVTYLFHLTSTLFIFYVLYILFVFNRFISNYHFVIILSILPLYGDEANTAGER